MKTTRIPTTAREKYLQDQAELKVCKAALAVKEKELAGLREKVSRWRDAGKGIILEPHQLTVDYINAADALRSAVSQKPDLIKANVICPDCKRQKARDAAEASMGFCPKWWAIHDSDAHDDCRRAAVEKQSDRLAGPGKGIDGKEGIC